MLFEFQNTTINTIIQKFESEKVIVLLGEEKTGKSFLAKEVEIYLKDTCTMYFEGVSSKRYTEYGCFPQSLLNGYRKTISKRKYSNSIKKDITASVANLLFVSVENTLDSFLTLNEKSEIEELINYVIEIIKKQNVCFIFDNVEYYDKKSMVFLYNIIDLISKKNLDKAKILIVLNQTRNSKQTILNEDLLEQFAQIQIARPSDNDLSNFLGSDNYRIGRNIPIKYLLDLKSSCSNLTDYYNKKLNLISQDNMNAKRILFVLILLDEEVSFNNLAIFMSDLPLTELFRAIELLKENSFLEWQEIEGDEFYSVPELVKISLQRDIPLYLSVNRFEMYARKIEQYSPLDYTLKYWLYSKAGNLENAYANAILSYCSIARGETRCSNEELKAFDNFLQNSLYKRNYEILNSAYRLYNTNEYQKSYTIINDYLMSNHFIVKQSIFYSVYIPEFIFEMIFLRGMCIGRLSNCSEELIRNQQCLLERLIDIMNLMTLNNEFILRIREQKLLLKTYLSTQSKKEQKDVYNEYFSICNQYQNYIRQSTIRTREKWEIRYASFLLKANIVSGIPDKLHILEKGYRILENNKKMYPEKYLKAACNLAGDYMWRGQIEHSRYILQNAIQLLENNNWLRYWGIIYQMYIFTKLYGNTSDTPEELLRDYSNKIWDHPEIRYKMHEMAICNSNYAILLAATGNYEQAYELLKKTLTELEADWNYYNEYLLSTNLGMVKYILGDIPGALELEEHCKDLIDKKLVPIFSGAFIKKRTSILLNIYSSKKKIDNVLLPLNVQQTLSTGYCSDNYFRPLLFSDINYWAD